VTVSLIGAHTIHCLETLLYYTFIGARKTAVLYNVNDTALGWERGRSFLELRIEGFVNRDIKGAHAVPGIVPASFCVEVLRSIKLGNRFRCVTFAQS
jgi:hypothetical protein